MITETRTGRRTGDGLLEQLIFARSDGEEFTGHQLRDEVVTFVIAGAETVATTLAWMFHELALHPAVDEQLCEELDRELGDKPVSYTDFERLPFVNAVISEVLRLHTPNWLLTRRAERSVALGGILIPEGDEVAFSLTTLHRDPKLFDLPMRFDPGRWLDGRTDLLHRDTLMPFGIGKHKCIGDTFAWAETIVAITAIVPEWRLVHHPNTRVRELPWTTVQPSGLTMIPRRRHLSARDLRPGGEA